MDRAEPRGAFHALAHGRERLTWRSAELSRPRPRNLDDEVETVDERELVPICREALR